MVSFSVPVDTICSLLFFRVPFHILRCLLNFCSHFWFAFFLLLSGMVSFLYVLGMFSLWSVH